MSSAFVIKERIEELEKRFDAIVDERRLRELTSSMVVEASQNQISECESRLNIFVEVAKYNLEREHTRIDREIDEKIDAEFDKLSARMLARMEAVETKVRRIEILIGFAVTLSVFAAYMTS